MLSRNPEQTRDVYRELSAQHTDGTTELGVIDSVLTPQIPHGVVQRQQGVDDVRRGLAHLRDHESAYQNNHTAPSFDDCVDVIGLSEAYDAVQSADAVLIGGGGNLNSTYGWLLCERASVAAMAASLDRPLVVSGQTLGPELNHSERAMLSEIAHQATLFGVRDTSSFALAQSLTDHAAVSLDDASFLANPGQGLFGMLTSSLAGTHTMAVTFSPATGARSIDQWAELVGVALQDICDELDMHVVFIPHMSDSEPYAVGAMPEAVSVDRDVQMHYAISQYLDDDRYVHVPIPVAPAAAVLTAAADIVVTSRFHPAVFALPSGVPVVAIASDEYTRVRMDGALGHWGQAGWAISSNALTPRGLQQAIAVVWSDREAIREGAHQYREANMLHHQRHWDDVVAALGGATPPAAALPAVTQRRRPAPITAVR